MSLQCGVPSGRLPRYARNDKVLRTEGKRMKSIAKTDKVFVWFILCHSEELYSNDVRIPRKGNLVIKPKTINAILSALTNFRTWSTPLFINISLLKSNKRELIKISIQFVCKLQSIIILYTKVNRSLFPYHMHLYLYLLKHTYYIW